MVQLDFGETGSGAVAFKSTADFYKTNPTTVAKKKEVSPVPTLSSLPTIGQLSGGQAASQEPNLPNGQLANLMEAPNKERYSSVDKQSQEVNTLKAATGAC